MSSRTRKWRRHKSAGRTSSSFQLERLESRVLLTAAIGGTDTEDYSEFFRPGYGLWDATYKDPFIQGPPSAGTLEWMDPILASRNGSTSNPFSKPNPFPPAGASGTSTLFLDFDGARVYSRVGDFWLGSDYVDIPAYNLTMFGWGGREAESKNYITEFIREDYAAYNINVTTTQPTSGEYTTLYVGGTCDWFRPGSSVIGVATYDVGNQDNSNYGFAFTEELGIYQSYSGGSLLNFSEYVANLVTHEAAHTYGANHISDTTEMMNPYLPITPRQLMFGQGPIPSSTETQDTQTLLGTTIGYAHGADDYGSTLSTASTISASGSTQAMLEKRNDVDAFKFTASQTGAINISLVTTVYGNLNGVVSVYRSSDSNLIAQNDDYGSSDDPWLSVNVVSGQQYTLLVSSSSGGTSGRYTLTLDGGPVTPDISIADNSGSTSDQAVDFGAVTINTSGTATVTITNSGLSNLVISQLTAGGVFSCSPTSQSGTSADDITITPGSQRAVTVSYQPQAAGTSNGTLTIVSNDPDHPTMTVSLAGQGQAPQPDIALAAASGHLQGATLNWGAIDRGVTQTETLTLHNDGYSTLTISSITTSGEFGIFSGYQGGTVSIQPDGQLTLVLQVGDDQRGVLTGLLQIASNDPDEALTTIDLQAQVVGGVLAIHENAQTADDNQIDFGDVYVGETIQQNITLTNAGDAALTVTGLSVDGGFVAGTTLNVNTSSDDIVLAVNQSVTVTLAFSPQGASVATGTVTIQTDDSEFPMATVALQAEGKVGALEITELDGLNDGQFDAGSLPLGQNYPVGVWQVTNHGNQALTISLSLEHRTNLALQGNSVLTLAADQTTTITVALTTAYACIVTDTLSLIANDAISTHQTLAVSVDAYALVTNRQSYSFTDHDGDHVRISLRGDAQAKVTIGQDDQPDIQAIEFLDGGHARSLTISVSQGSTRLGRLTGHADIDTLKAPDVVLAGAGIALDGTIKTLQLRGIDQANCDFVVDNSSLRLGDITGDSRLNLTGSVRSFAANSFTGGQFTADDVGQIVIDGELNAGIRVGGDLDLLMLRHGDLRGSLQVDGTLKQAVLSEGDLLGNITAGQDIQRLLAARGTIEGSVHAGAAMGLVRANNINQARLTALNSIDRVVVLNNMVDSLVAVGYDPYGSTSHKTALPAVNARLNALSVNGTFASSTVAVGVAPDDQGSFINGSGNVATGILGTARLAHVETSNSNSPFGIVAQDNVDRLLVNRRSISDTYQENDFVVNVLKK